MEKELREPKRNKFKKNFIAAKIADLNEYSLRVHQMSCVSISFMFRRTLLVI